MELPADVTPDQLDPSVRADLRSLSKETADLVARHLVVTGRLLDEDPERALAHARAATALGGRVGAVREAAGLAAYAAGEWQEALSELRTYRRISGEAVHLPVLADCERALGRPERALAAADDPAVPALAQDVRVELALVLAGARRDLGQAEAAVVLLQGPARATTARHGWAARLWYGYADALLDAGRRDEAETWFAKVVDVDQGETDADERLLELQGLVVGDEDGEGPEAPDGEPGAEAGAPMTQQELDDLVKDARPPVAAAVSPAEPSAAEPAEPAELPAAELPTAELPAAAKQPSRPVPAVTFVDPGGAPGA